MDFATRKLGPLPVWGWAVLGLVGFLALRWYRAKGASTQATTDTQAAADQQTQQLLAALTGVQAAITSQQTAAPNTGGSSPTATTGGQPPPAQPSGTFWAWRVLPSGRLSAPEEFFLAPNLAAQPPLGPRPYGGGSLLGFPGASSIDGLGAGLLPPALGGGAGAIGSTSSGGSTSGGVATVYGSGILPLQQPSGTTSTTSGSTIMPAPGPAASAY